MKKTLLTLGLLTAFTATSQNVITFEDLTLAPGTSNDVSDDAGSFISGGTTFYNVWTTSQWGDYWSAGFNYSNEVNTADAGSETSFAGTGANGSSNYAVYYSGLDASIDFGSEKGISSVMLTNATYAGISMQNGDMFGKVFGSVNNAQGTPDGTNGEDFFFVRIMGLDADSTITDTVIFYLADFRFADNQQDYILNTWQSVDLTPLGNIRYLAFELESSDVGGFGMNTPAYFALDNLAFGNVGINELTETFSMYPNPANEHVTINGKAGNITVYDATGKVVLSETSNGIHSMNTENWTPGLYIVELASETGTGRSTLMKK